MNERAKILETVLDRFSYRGPLSPDVQKYMLSCKQQAAAATLQHFGDYNFFYGLSMKVFFRTRRLGFRLSVRQCRAVLAIAASILAAIIAAGIISAWGSRAEYPVTVNRPAAVEVGPEKEKVTIKTEMKKTRTKKAKAESAARVRYRLGIETLASSAVSGDEAEYITGLITDELVRLKGSSKVQRIEKKGRKNANMILLGGIEKLGEKYIITAKIIDAEKGSVMVTFYEKAGSRNEVPAACVKIAGSAAERIE